MMKKALFVLWLVVIFSWVPILSRANTPELVVVAGISLGFWAMSLVLLLLGLMSPVIVSTGFLVNNPKPKIDENGDVHVIPIEPGRIYFFTLMEPGQAKVKVRGGKFVGAIMEDSERVFVGKEIDPNPKNADHWWVRDAKPNEKSEPLAPLDLWNPLSWWIHWVYHFTGAVFVGFWPFQGLRIVKNRRTKPVVENGKVVLDSQGRPKLEEVEDWSDHFRTKDFFWYFGVPSADTKDFLKIGFQGNLLARCINPFLAAFNRDGWDNALNQKIDTEITAYSASKNYGQIASLDESTRYELGEFILGNLNKSLCPDERGAIGKRGIGIEIMEADITDRNPQLEPDERKALTANWKAERDAAATVTTAQAEKKRRVLVSEGEAKAIINKVRASRNHAELALALAEFEAWKEVKGSALFNFGKGGGGSTGNASIDVAILQKLGEISEQLKNGGKS